MGDTRRAVVLLSGGMDSCVCGAMARERHGAGNVGLVHASYGQRTEARERRAFEEIANFFGVRERLMVRLDHFRAIGGSALTDERIAVPENELGAAGQVEGGSAIPVTYVPFRNAHFLSVGVSWAEAIGAGAIYIGAVAEDSSGYPDCRPEYYRVFQELIRMGTKPGTEIEIVTPVIGMRKSEIVRCGIALGAPLHLTWSCYQSQGGEDLACGVCDSCTLRLRAFAEAGVADPIPYRRAVAAER
jgi:7-cyano-7-deazaguanine synthase